jgi:uncharacterized protein (TIGR00369 family)
MSDDGAIHRPHRIDIEVAGRAIEAGRARMEEGFGPDHDNGYSRRRRSPYKGRMSLQDDPVAMLADRMSRETPHAVALGVELVSVEPGTAVMKVGYRADLIGDPQTGVLAGGVITSLLDHVCGLAVTSVRLGGAATLDLRIDYMRSAEPGRDVFARAHCYKLTRAIGFVRAIAFEDDADDPIATAQGAFALSAPRTASPAP